MAKDHTFVVRILDNADNAFRGTVHWINTERTESFRSTLELMKLLDSAVTAEVAPREAGTA